MDWIESLVLGIIQGITEFLPVSSDGHLNVASMAFDRLTGRGPSDERAKIFFFVMLHLGTLAAILLHYRRAIAAGARGLLGSSAVPPGFDRGNVVRVGLLAAVATLPLVPDKLFLMDLIEEAFRSPIATGVGFFATAAVLLATTLLPGGAKGPRETRFLDALIIGIAQMAAPLPGVSRSGLTIASALLLGLGKAWAVGFSLLMAVPAILGAAAFEIKDVDRSTLSAARLAQTGAATVVAGVVGYLAILWLVRVVKSGRLWYFSVYLIALGVLVILLGARSIPEARSDARPEAHLERTVRGPVLAAGR